MGTPAMCMLSLMASVLPDNLPLLAPTISVIRALHSAQNLHSVADLAFFNGCATKCQRHEDRAKGVGCRGRGQGRGNFFGMWCMRLRSLSVLGNTSVCQWQVCHKTSRLRVVVSISLF